MYAQQAWVKGSIKDEQARPIADVLISIAQQTVLSDANGFFQIAVPAEKDILLQLSKTGFIAQQYPLRLKKEESRLLAVQLKERIFEIKEVVKRADRQRFEAGAIIVDASKANINPSTIGGIEGLIKTLVGSTNELTSQYNVRGGNYDENLVYVNDFEITRPFLVRSGQQEGLSFVNADLTSHVQFSVGGFQSKYGDKMSSVLDITYKKPKQFAGSASLSLLGGSLHIEGASKNNKLTYLVGLRQKTNQYLLQAQPTKGVYNPSFTDVQTLINYKVNEQWEWEFLANYARNRFTFYPEEQTASFGLVNKAYQLRMYYTGAELDQFDTRFTGVSTTYRPNKNLRLKFLASAYSSNEKETYDISGEYLLGELETDLGKANFGQVKTYLGTGVIQNYARNFLQVQQNTIGHRGSYIYKKQVWLWGADWQSISIKDQLLEWERRDSAGFTQPYNPAQLTMMKSYRSTADLSYEKIQGFVQNNFKWNDSLDLTFSVLNTQLLAQKSMHVVLGYDYNAHWGRRPLRITNEVYYKSLWDIVPYEYDNIRIRYFGKNNASGYAYGLETRLYGDLVKNATSWISLGLMKTAEDLNDDFYILKNVSGVDSAVVRPGYIPRPSDQRLMLGMYFEDYMPNNDNIKVHLNFMYGTGLPFGPPDQIRRYWF
ncbi:MAG: TonB-dependent receptor [Chitinophagia bacterium]|nr:TonB-dependent receptor [Chitinophagia bacterium]